MSIVIGLTGPTGSGKSSASKTAATLGFKVVDCDKLARVAVEKETDGLADLVSVFGSEILNEDGTLNRKELAKKAFSTKENTDLLNKTLLPHIAELVKKEINTERVLLDAPTLFESGINSMCNATVAVLADKDIRLDRICKRDSIDKEAALLRINAGKTDDFYLNNADFIIYNNKNEEDFKKEFCKIICDIKLEKKEN